MTKSIHTSANINWISALQGMAIVLVVMNHVRLYDASIGDDYAFVHRIRDVFQPFFMATFFFISGMLLYYTRMSSEWRTFQLYKDKTARLIVPLLFCTVLGCASQAVFNGVVKHPKVIGIDTLLYALLDYDTTPWPHRWYLVSLVWIMALYPCYRYISDRGVKAEVMAVAATIAVYLVDFTDWVDTNWCYAFTLNKHLPFFSSGHHYIQVQAVSISAVCFGYVHLLGCILHDVYVDTARRTMVAADECGGCDGYD